MESASPCLIMVYKLIGSTVEVVINVWGKFTLLTVLAYNRVNFPQ